MPKLVLTSSQIDTLYCMSKQGHTAYVFINLVNGIGQPPTYRETSDTTFSEESDETKKLRSEFDFLLREGLIELINEYLIIRFDGTVNPRQVYRLSKKGAKHLQSISFIKSVLFKPKCPTIN